MMEEMLEMLHCGPCARQALTLEERIAVAEKREANENYRCPVCYKLHQWEWKYSAKQQPAENLKPVRRRTTPIERRFRQDDLSSCPKCKIGKVITNGYLHRCDHCGRGAYDGKEPVAVRPAQKEEDALRPVETEMFVEQFLF